MENAMYVVLLLGVICIAFANETTRDQHEELVVKVSQLKNDVESLRFTMYLYSYFNAGLIVILIYLSWRAYKRQEKFTEWRV